MRFIHTADWHLGRRFYGIHLTDDQRYVLDQLIEVAREVRPDAILVAGDIYDRSVPPPEAVELLDEVLSKLVIDLKIPVVLIAGNHDSPGRLNFGARMLAGRRLYVTGNLPKTCSPLVLNDEHGPVYFYALPFAEPVTVRHCLECEELPDHDAAMRALLAPIRAAHPPGARSVLIAHAFVAGAAGCESERPLSVGGAGMVDAGCFMGFDYVALGHLHRPQSINGGQIRYCGSLLQYSFDEADSEKLIHVIDMDGAGACRCESIPLRPRHNVRRITGRIDDLLTVPADGPALDDYLEITPLDAGPVFDAMGRLRKVYPNVMTLGERPATLAGESVNLEASQVRAMNEMTLFKTFYAHVAGAALSEAQEQIYIDIVKDMHRREREQA